MNRYSWILCDVDNTLVDSSSRDALEEAFSVHAIPFQDSFHRTFLDINTLLWKQFQEGVLSSDDVTIKRFVELAEVLKVNFDPLSFSQAYADGLLKHVRLTSGAAETLHRLAARFSLVAATNGIAAIQKRKLATGNLDKFFKHILISETVGHPKPSLEFFEALHATIGGPALASMIIVGDSVSADILGGSQFGIDTCWYNPRGKPNTTDIAPTYEIRDLRELCDLIENAQPVDLLDKQA